MFWKKKPQAEDDPRAGARAGTTDGAAAGAAPHADAALDTAVGMLRTLGRYAFDITGMDAQAFRRRCEAWAEHLAVGAPHPDRPGAPGTGAVSGTPAAPAGLDAQDRDWAGARHFVVPRRQDECEYLARSVGDLREVIADLTQRLATSLTEDQEADRRVGEQVER